MDPRRAAFKVLSAIDTGPQRLEKLLHQTLGAGGEERDRAMAFGLVYGVLRHRLRLDYLLARVLNRPLSSLDAPVLTVLRLGAADVVLMRTPDHAAVHAAVALAKATPARRGQGLVNAGLRALARRWPELPLPAEADGPARALAVRHSHPQWLVEELLSAWGRDEVEPWLAANQEEPPLSLRVNTLAAGVDQVAELLAPRAKTIEPHPLAPDCLVLRGVKGRVTGLPGFARGLWQAQDPAAAAVTTLLGVEPGMRILDMCAGAGGKTGHLAALLGGGKGLMAVEPSAGRARALAANLKRLGVKGVTLRRADATKLKEAPAFQRILIDAPCSGLGTCGRRPDLRWRRDPDDARRLAPLQLALCKAAAGLLAPGGAMLYATCTVTAAENQSVVEGLLAARDDLRLEWDPRVGAAARAAIGGDGFFRTLPHRHHSDAFFAARLVKA